MVHVVVGATNPNCREKLARMFRQRYDVFVKEKGWKLKTYNGLEFDQYDTAETIYLMQFDRDGDLVASMRMNPTDGPFMLADIFGEVCQKPIPHGRDVWELTRGALSRNLRKSGYWGRLQCAMLESALLWGAKKAVGFFTVDHIMKQLRVGLDISPLGPPRIIDGEANVAAEFPFNSLTLERLRASYGIVGPAIEQVHMMPAPQKAVA
jgi:N-acyl-L-homoserine lactone synthetase